ncbi:MAG: PAS domain S-box protein [Nitrospirales bacterium]|nr:PAS domain-containing protein [Nitrospira sp.]MDR4500524.1 PAS domain S-box protein [Nitrospirales bacterium]
MAERQGAGIAREGSAKRFHAIFENAGIGMVNPAYARMHGYAPDELIGKPMASVLTEESRMELPEVIRRVHRHGHLSYESTNLRKDGTTFLSLVMVSVVKDRHGKLLYRVRNISIFPVTYEQQQN